MSLNLFKLEQKNNKIIIKLFNFKIFSYYRNNFKKFIKGCFASFCCIFIPNKYTRKRIRRDLTCTIIKNPNLKRRQEPVEPYAFIRIKNEISTIETSLNSILPAINKGVIAFNECDDGSEEYIMKFCELHPGFIPYKYPYSLFPLNDARNGLSGNDEHKIHTYYNKALELIPKGEWLVKIDIDQIYNAEKLKKMFYLPKDDNDVVILSRFNLHYDKNGEIFFIKNAPMLIATDHWLIKNDNLEFQLDNNKTSFVERLDISGYNIIFSEFNNYHFPFIKSSRKIDYDNLEKFDAFISNGHLRNYIKKYQIDIPFDEDMLDRNKILNFCKTFNMDRKRILPTKE